MTMFGIFELNIDPEAKYKALYNKKHNPSQWLDDNQLDQLWFELHQLKCIPPVIVLNAKEAMLLTFYQGNWKEYFQLLPCL